ncbi:AMP-binding protein [Mesorhizobium sp.]|uniref:acyl carrier protein n=1 Tax=Mesorhizobium sp. TaxID=1871066 RepID=UPI0025E30BD8|nr:AMP-binding protein [Mesorhizobium sp.]
MVPTTIDDRRSREGDLIAVVREFVHELQPKRANAIDISPSSRIERDLGIDSLGRTELILRIERAFRVRLPTQIVGEADTIGDLINALEHAGARPGWARAAQPTTALPPVPAATEAKTLVEVLDWHVAQHPDRLHLTVLQDDTTALGAMTYAELAQSARVVAAGLIRRNVEPGDRIALMLPTSLDFFSAFLGILYAGAVPVPIYPPMRRRGRRGHPRRAQGRRRLVRRHRSIHGNGACGRRGGNARDRRTRPRGVAKARS